VIFLLDDPRRRLLPCLYCWVLSRRHSEAMLTYLGLIVTGGLLGGSLAAWLASDRTLLPAREPLPRGGAVLRPGLMLTALAGALAAVAVAVLYGLYGVGGAGLSMYTAPFGAILVGLGVGSMLCSRAQQRFLAAARDEAARTAILLLSGEQEPAEEPHRP
jgi:hypothetical protein